MIYLVNSLPNKVIVPPSPGFEVVIEKIELQEAIKYLRRGFKSNVGHQNYADALSILTGLDIEMNREEVFYDTSDLIIAAIVIPPGRLEEGESWTEDQFLEMPIRWAKIRKQKKR